MKHGRLDGMDRRLWKRASKDRVELIVDPAFCFRGHFGLRQDVERKLAAEHFFFHLLKIEKTDCLFLQLVYACVSSLRSGCQDSHSGRLYCKLVVHMRKYFPDHDGCWMRVHKVT